jgi:hypothetical protein
MSQPLDAAQRKSVEQALEALARLLECLQGLTLRTYLEEQRAAATRELAALRALLADGRIDIRSGRESIQAQTDRHGIHINDNQQMFSLPGELALEDCNAGYFGSAWLILAMLIHERYHYEQNTGLRGALRAPFDLVGGSLSLVWSGIVQGQTLRSWKWKEFAAYGASYAMLTSLGWLLDKVCKEKPLCIRCCHKHLAAIQEAAARQNPWSTYGA